MLTDGAGGDVQAVGQFRGGGGFREEQQQSGPGTAEESYLFAAAGLAVRPAVRWARRDGDWRGEAV